MRTSADPPVIGVTDEGFLIVTHTHHCPHWSPQGADVLCPTRECWYCRWADFRKTTQVRLKYSVCRNPNNQVAVDPGRKNETPSNQGGETT